MKKDKKNSFNTPEGYFESFNERLMARIQEEATDEASSIIPKTDGFGVPESYFDDVVPKVLSRTTEEKGKVIQLKSYRKIYYGAAAVAAVFLLIFGFNWKSEPSPVTFDDLANTEIDAYFDNNRIDMSSYELAEMVSFENVQLNDMLEDDLSGEVILEYLDENVDDLRDLNIEYIDYE
ncbi:hypothetical protein [Flagellimonas aequoris]|uniref:Uncharacterized protein n=1 Tax=Flagellimonas aequoris TaxID=2306997 RepID=A0A418N3I7_9FLAO|nr:hypothetical protein [Allomuricauda aequoris]RIV68376.1 hypothetical protein D2U88_14230 [Allomuricauda aequoris]TXK00068.1 hypothetical protein FQ019_14075 [Allomuricauda aequoris]